MKARHGQQLETSSHACSPTALASGRANDFVSRSRSVRYELGKAPKFVANTYGIYFRSALNLQHSAGETKDRMPDVRTRPPRD